jgi:CBS domain-containing protein
MLSQRIRHVMERDTMVTGPPDATVLDAARLMREHRMGAVMVVRDGSLVGIFSERDVVFRVVAPGLDAHSVRMVDVMTPDPLTVDPDTTFGHALVLMHEHGFRHLPVVEHGRLIGIVSARDAVDPALEDFICEQRRRESFG